MITQSFLALFLALISLLESLDYEILGQSAHAILALVYCYCHDFRSVSETEHWIKTTDLCTLFGIKEITEKMLRDGVVGLANSDKLTMQKSIFEKINQITKIKDASVIYDVTNTYFTEKRCKIGKVGMDKEGVRGRKVVQIGLAITKIHGLPIFCQVHPGNIHDAKIFKQAVCYLKLFDIKGGLIAYDRGITSKDSLFDLTSAHWKIIAGMSANKTLKNIISKMDLNQT